MEKFDSRFIIQKSNNHCQHQDLQDGGIREIDVGTRKADFMVENTVAVKLKALINLEDVHLAQVKTDVVSSDFSKKLQINFGSATLQYKLVFNPKFHPVKS